MPRPKLAILSEIKDIVTHNYKVFRQYKILMIFFSIVILILLLAALFSFLKLAQTVSPFVYPLF